MRALSARGGALLGGALLGGALLGGALLGGLSPQSGLAAPSARPLLERARDPARLAVLEVQGTLGALEERQAWSDAIRAAALSRLAGRAVGVIDRAQFELLLPPSEELASCVGMCEAQVARAVGARWSLSARLAAQGGGAGRWTLTLKLHAADGELLKVAQRAHLTPAEISGALAPLTAEALSPLAPPDPAPPLARPSAPEPAHEPEPPLAPAPSAGEEEAWTHRADGLRWRLAATPDGPLCFSERVPAARYAEGVRAGRVAPAGSWGRCPGAGAPRWAIQTCVDAQQAALFALHLGAQVPSEPLLLALYGECPACAQQSSGAYEWALTPSERAALSSPLAPAALRAAPKSLALRLDPPASTRGGAGQVTRRFTPPSFRVPDVSFRLARPPRADGCGAEVKR